jgi:hypothetical protein
MGISAELISTMGISAATVIAKRAAPKHQIESQGRTQSTQP